MDDRLTNSIVLFVSDPWHADMDWVYGNFIPWLNFFDGSVVTYVITIMDTMRFWRTLDSSHHPFQLGGWFIGSVAFLGKSGLKMSQSTLRVEFAFLSSHQVLAPGFKEGGLMGYLRGKASHRDYVEGELICWASPCLSLSPLLSQFDVSSTASSRKPLTSSQWHRASKGLSVLDWAPKCRNRILVRIVVNGASDHQCAAVQRIDTAGILVRPPAIGGLSTQQEWLVQTLGR